MDNAKGQIDPFYIRKNYWLLFFLRDCSSFVECWLLFSCRQYIINKLWTYHNTHQYWTNLGICWWHPNMIWYDTCVIKEIWEGKHQFLIYSFLYMLMPFRWALVHKLSWIHDLYITTNANVSRMGSFVFLSKSLTEESR